MNYLNLLKFLLVCAIVIAALVATSAEPASLQSNNRVEKPDRDRLRVNALARAGMPHGTRAISGSVIRLSVTGCLEPRSQPVAQL
jgi:hypothetical protein